MFVSPIETIYQRIAGCIGIVVGLTGVAVLFGWFSNIDQLKSVVPGLPTMKFNTACCFLLCGISLYIYQKNHRSKILQNIVRICAASALTLALLTLLEYGITWNLGIDEFFIQDMETAEAMWPGRMSPATAVAFTLLSLALLSLDLQVNWKKYLSPYCALAGAVIGSVALLGYVYGVQTFQVFLFSSIAVHTSILFILMGISIIFVRTDYDPAAVIVSDRIGGKLIRNLLPAVVLVPALLGWICMVGLKSGHYKLEFAFALNSLASITILTTLVWIGAKSLNRMHARIDIANRQQAFLASIVESSEDAIASKNINGIVTSWNPGAERIYGYSAAEMLGRSMSMLIPAEHIDEERLILDQIRRGQRVDPIESVRQHKDGHLLDMSITVSPITSADEVIGASHIGRDITERKRAEERIRVVVEASPSAMVMVGCEGGIVLVNSQTEKTFACSRDQLIGQKIEMLLPLRFRQAHTVMRSTFFSQLESRVMGAGRDLYALRPDGSEFPVEIGLNPIETSEGTFVLAAIVDITERKRAEENLHLKTQELIRSNQDLEQFAYVASHDLQEPLRAISGCMQLLQQDYGNQLDARANEFMSHAIDGAIRMQALIEGLLLYSRVGRSKNGFQQVDSESLLQAALKNLAVAIDEAQAKISYENLPTIQAVPAQMIMLFQNLVGNAIKFRQKDLPVTVSISAEPLANEWLFTIADNGIGIDSHYFERIFTIFQRLHTRREYPGTGIGLALCRRIVEHHGGRIWLESSPGRGTTIYFTISVSGTSVNETDAVLLADED